MSDEGDSGQVDSGAVAVDPGFVSGQALLGPDSIPADLQEHDFFQRTMKGKSVADLARVALDSHQEVGRRIPADKAFRIPEADDPNGWEPMLSKMRPVDPSKYDVKFDNTLGLSDEYLTTIKQNFWDMKLSNNQAQTFANILADADKTSTEQAERETQQQEAEEAQLLREKFGDAYAENMEYATRILNEWPDITGKHSNAMEYFKSVGMGTDPVLLSLSSGFGNVTAEGRMVAPKGGSVGAIGSGESSQAIQQQIDMLNNSPRATNTMDTTFAKELEALTGRRIEAERQEHLARSGYPSR